MIPGLSEEALFNIARRIHQPEDRRLYLAQSCGGDGPLRARLDALLRAYDEERDFLAAPVSARPSETQGPASETAGSIIGHYKLLEQLGEGGFGVVFMAEQLSPIRRTVALKVLKPGMDSKQVIARFEAEQRALERMDHPNIARVLDAGQAASGRPYFVMELVQGMPITEYCDQARLTIRERLELFIPVCQAIQHAHQKGVIHRDIKPGNVLVSLHGGKGVPRVIDFGVAKAIDLGWTEQTAFTQDGAIVGTLEYMSPEQAGRSGVDIDARCDIYALGVLLYELLTGSTPLERSRIHELDRGEILRRIKEDEPLRPSNRVSDSTEKLALIASRRGVEAKHLVRAIAGDLDWIVIKALEKDRTRRYDTASGLARDVQRYLDQDPVEARPPSRAYRAGKFARKHRRALGVAAVFVLLLLGSSVVSTALMLRARSAEQLMSQALEEIRQAQGEAQSEALKAKAINDFLTDDLMTQAEPAMNAVEDRVALVDVLDRAAENVGARFGGQPGVESALRQMIAKTYHGLASWAKAEQQWRTLLESARERNGAESREALWALSELAHVLHHRGRHDAEVLEMARSASEGLERMLGPEDPNALVSRDKLAQAYAYAGRTAEAIKLYEPMLSLWESQCGPDDPNTIGAYNNLAVAYRFAGRLDEAIKLLESTLTRLESKRGADHPGTLITRNNLASVYQRAGRFAQAINLLEPKRAALESRLGFDHPNALSARHILGAAYRDAGRIDDSIKLLESTLALEESKLGPDHPSTLGTRDSLATTYRNAGRVPEAIKLLEPTVTLLDSKLGADHLDALSTRNNLALTYLDAGRFAESIKLLEPIVALRELKLGPDHPDTLVSRNNLGTAYEKGGRVAEAIKVLEPARALMESRLGVDHPNTLAAYDNLATAYRKAGRAVEAIKLYEATFKARESKLGLEHHDTVFTGWSLAMAYRQANRNADSVKLLESMCALLESKRGLDHRDTLITRSTLAVAYRAAGRLDRAISVCEMMLNHMERVLGRDDLVTLATRANLAVDCQKVGRYADSIELLRPLVAILESKRGPDHGDTLATCYNLARAYHLAGRDAEAIPVYETTLRRREARLGPDQLDTLLTAHDLAHALEATRPQEAEPLFRRAHEGYVMRQGRDAPMTFELDRDLALLLERTGRPVEAERFYRELLDRQGASLPADSPARAGILAMVGTNLLNQRKWSEAEAVLRECLAIRQKAQPDDWSTFNTRSQLGGALLSEGRFAEAEPLVVAGYEGLKTRAARIPDAGWPRLVEASRRVVELYEAWGRSADADTWRQRLGLADLPEDVFGR